MTPRPLLHRLLPRLVLAALCAGFLADAGAGPAGTIVIGHAVDLSGPDAALGRDYVAGFKTGLDMANAAGGIHGRRLQYLVRDDRGQPEATARLANELIERDRADVLVGGIGDDAVRAALRAPAFRASGQLLFAPLATAAFGLRERVLFWRPAYREEVRHVLDHFARLGVRQVAVVAQEGGGSADALRSLEAELAVRRMQLAASARIGGGTEIPVEASRVAQARPGVVLVIADTISTALFLKEFRRHDGQTFVAGTSLINLDTLQELAGPKAMEWTVFSQVVPDPGAGKSVLQVEHLNMMRKYRDEAVSSLTLEGFAAAKALVQALRQAQSPGRALQELVEQGRAIDLGGITAAASAERNHLSGYLDIALYRKGSGLRF